MALMYDQTRWHVTKFQPVVLLMEEIRLTSWYVVYPIIYRVLYISGVGGFLSINRMAAVPDMGICWSSQSGTLDRNVPCHSHVGSEKRHDFSTQNITPVLFWIGKCAVLYFQFNFCLQPVPIWSKKRDSFQQGVECCRMWSRQSMKFDALCDFVEEELLDIKKRVIQVENGEASMGSGDFNPES